MPARLGARRELFVGIFVLAVLLRLIPLLVGGGLGFWNGYDDSVYYAAADSLTFGHLPYRDFLLLHPPGIAVLMLPFAALGRLTTDATGMIVARCAFIALGAVNACLVSAIAYRWSRRAALLCGILYACWYPAVVTEQTPRLEPVGTTLLLVALLLLLRRDPHSRDEWLAGAALGLATGVKIWGVAPWAVLLICVLLRRRWVTAVRVAAGGAAALAVLLVPFFVAAPGRMFDMVVRDQLRRPVVRAGRDLRLSSTFGVDSQALHHLAVAAVVVAILLVAAAICLRDRTARPIVALLAVNLAVLMASPTYYRHYAEFVAAPAALVIGLAADRLSIGPVVAGALALAGGVAALAIPQHLHVVDRRVTAAVPAGCLTSDDPGVLIQLDRLSKNISAGCPLEVDVWGRQQDGVEGLAWQHYLRDYLTSGSAFIVARPSQDGLSPQTQHELDAHPLLAEADGLVLRRGR